MSANALRHEKSPYLLQHADNPVDWFPWGDAAFRKAQAEDKPIFLSIGYSTCHWCHVMAHESFENAGTAALLNAHFVPVKVDREERPDVDRVYMAFVQATTGQGGWPMSVWLTPDLKPFYGGTYFPPADRYGRPGFPSLLRRIADLWADDREGIVRQGEQVLKSLAAAFTPAGTPPGSPLPGAEALDAGFESVLSHFDAEEGGFSGAPKFPRPAILHFLFRHAARAGLGGETGRKALEMAGFTLDRMAAGGMRDHLGGGFHRYSVDALWHVPHFEKMLYDQAQLASAYLDAFQATGAKRHAAVAREILDYVLRDLTGPHGGFLSAEDADSFLEPGKPDHAEGAFYVWTAREIGEALGADAALFSSHYGVEPEGNAPPGSDPHGEFTGKNILIERRPLAGTAKAFGIGEDQAAFHLAQARKTLLERRALRPRPHRDDKVIAAWNGLAISAFARAGEILGEPRYLDAAVKAADFILAELRDPATGNLLRSYREGPARIGAFADDHAFLVAAFLDLFEATADLKWLREALTLQQRMDTLFWDKRDGGYFPTSGEDPTILIRGREDYDGAEPAAGSVAAENLVRLHRLLGHASLLHGAEKTVLAAAGAVRNAPIAVPRLLAALEALHAPPLHVVIVGHRHGADTADLLAEVHRHFLPHRTLLLLPPGKSRDFLGEQGAFFRSLPPIDGRATAYVCENFACRLPVTDREGLRSVLLALAPR